MGHAEAVQEHASPGSALQCSSHTAKTIGTSGFLTGRVLAQSSG